jgi:ectoine hydroxylase-related dioxygenase (phytanoyl-CoA dioxygenase family)
MIRTGATATPGLIERFDRDGFAIAPGALSAEEVEALTEAVDRTYLAERGCVPGAGADPLHLLAFAGREPAFLGLLDHPAILPAIVELLGWNIFMYHCHLDVHPPTRAPVRDVWMWHQDGGVQHRDLGPAPQPMMSVKAAFFLTDLSEPGRGNLMVVPGSHRAPDIERPPDGSLDLPGAMPVLVSPGDAVLFDRRLWHMRSRNESTLTRRALFLAYTYRWVRARDDLHVAPELFSSITPIRAQLLGAGTGAIGHWIPTDEDVPLRT